LKPITVLIADDHKILRKGLTAILAHEDDIDIVAEATNGREAVEASQLLKPDVVLLDIAMPEMSGLLATSAIVKSNQKTKVLILSMHLSETFITETLRSGASGYILKDCATDELITAIKSVTRGGTYLSPKVANLVVKQFINTSDNSVEGVFGVLSPRELEILQLISEGKTTKRISEILILSPKTIDSHRANISRKLDLHDIPSLVKYAIRAGICEA
jgi:DNA-binding NarL/FixJ family response regulator